MEGGRGLGKGGVKRPHKVSRNIRAKDSRDECETIKQELESESQKLINRVAAISFFPLDVWKYLSTLLGFTDLFSMRIDQTLKLHFDLLITDQIRQRLPFVPARIGIETSFIWEIARQLSSFCSSKSLEPIRHYDGDTMILDDPQKYPSPQFSISMSILHVSSLVFFPESILMTSI